MAGGADAAAIRKVCVIGAGTMGAGIAAQVANAGVPVLLLDIVPREGGEAGANRNAVAQGAVTRMLRTEPAPFMSARAARLIETGNIEDHLGRVAECDWIVEAVVERLDIKQALYARLEPLRRPGAAVSSNTSTIPLESLVAGRSAEFRRDFLITHFFNPPRYMRLIEIVAGAESDSATVARVCDFVDRALGKRVVHAHDTPGFIANRIGTFWMLTAMHAALDLGLGVEEADQIAGAPMGVPKTGVFALADLVGIDLMPLLTRSLSATLPPDDAFFAVAGPLPLVDRMIAAGQTGRKGKGGFYRLDKAADGKRSKLAIDLATGEYRPEAKPPPLPAEAVRDLSALAALPGRQGAFAWALLAPVLAYAAGLAGEIADDIAAIDDAMKLGYNWRWGPFELLDRFGPAAFAARLRAEGRPVPPILQTVGEGRFYRVEGGRRRFLTLSGEYAPIARPEGVLLLEDIRLRAAPLAANESASLWDSGDGVAVLEFTGKMNALDEAVLAMIEQAVAIVGQNMRALVLYNEGANFSAGANLALALGAIRAGQWAAIEALVSHGQRALKALKYAPFPVVAAPAGMALGGGCEICLHADAIQAHAETYIGLVETGVGLVPGWGGNGEMLDRLAKSRAMPRGPMPAVARAFEMISTARVSKSAAEAGEMAILREGDGVTMNRDRLLADARARALAMAEGYVPPRPPVFHLPGASGRAGLAEAVRGFASLGMATAYDTVIAGRLAEILTGGDADPLDELGEDALLGLERLVFAACIRDERSQARIAHMLETGKPLRN